MRAKISRQVGVHSSLYPDLAPDPWAHTWRVKLEIEARMGGPFYALYGKLLQNARLAR